MKKLILILLAFLAIFTFIRAFEQAEASEPSAETPAVMQAEVSIEKTMEITQ